MDSQIEHRVALRESLMHILDGDMPIIAKRKTSQLMKKRRIQKKWKEQVRVVQTLILASIGDQLQRKFLDTPAKEIMAQLEKMFTDSARKERYKTTICTHKVQDVGG